MLDDELLMAYLTDSLEPGERADIRRALLGNEELRQRLSELEERLKQALSTADDLVFTIDGDELD